MIELLLGFRALTQKRISTSDVPPVNPDVIEALTRHSLDVPPPPPDVRTRY